MPGDKISQTKKRYASSVLKKKGTIITSTGGGEPIPEGKKWTDEERDPSQPRTDDGKFGTKASVGQQRKYPDHAWRGTYAKGSDMDNAKSEAERKKIWEANHKHDSDQAKDLRHKLVQKFAQKIKAGSKVAVNGSVFVVAIDMTADEFMDMLRNYIGDEKTGHFQGDSAVYAKRGRRTAAEKEALGKSAASYHGDVELVTGKGGGAEIANLKTPYMKSEVANAVEKYKKEKKAGAPVNDYSKSIKKASLDKNSAKYKANQSHNNGFAAKKASEQPNPTPAPQPAPQSQPAQATQNPAKKTFDYHEAEKDPEGFYSSNKEFFDKKVKAFNEKYGKNWDAQRYIKAWVNQKKSSNG